jgi:hypothetical protein
MLYYYFNKVLYSPPYFVFTLYKLLLANIIKEAHNKGISH